MTPPLNHTVFGIKAMTVGINPIDTRDGAVRGIEICNVFFASFRGIADANVFGPAVDAMGNGKTVAVDEVKEDIGFPGIWGIQRRSVLSGPDDGVGGVAGNLREGATVGVVEIIPGTDGFEFVKGLDARGR